MTVFWNGTYYKREVDKFRIVDTVHCHWSTYSIKQANFVHPHINNLPAANSNIGNHHKRMLAFVQILQRLHIFVFLTCIYIICLRNSTLTKSPWWWSQEGIETCWTNLNYYDLLCQNKNNKSAFFGWFLCVERDWRLNWRGNDSLFIKYNCI
jgi:hypothetical protein